MGGALAEDGGELWLSVLGIRLDPLLTSQPPHTFSDIFSLCLPESSSAPLH